MNIRLLPTAGSCCLGSVPEGVDSQLIARSRYLHFIGEDGEDIKHVGIKVLAGMHDGPVNLGVGIVDRGIVRGDSSTDGRSLDELWACAQNGGDFHEVCISVIPDFVFLYLVPQAAHWRLPSRRSPHLHTHPA